jgi:hypothetical protein
MRIHVHVIWVDFVHRLHACLLEVYKIATAGLKTYGNKRHTNYRQARRCIPRNHDAFPIGSLCPDEVTFDKIHIPVRTEEQDGDEYEQRNREEIPVADIHLEGDNRE